MTKPKSTVPSPLTLDDMVKGAGAYAFILFDPTGIIRFWNTGAKRIFGYGEEEAVGRDFRLLCTPEDCELGMPEKELELARGQGWADDERWHIAKDGTRVWANGVLNCHRDQSGEVVGFSKVIREQTLRKLTEDRLKSSLAEASQFARSAAHDLAEPLRTVTAYLQLIERESRGKVSARLDELLGYALDGSRRMQRLLTDLLAYARFEHASRRVELADTAAIFDNALANLKALADETGARVTRSNLPVIEGVETELEALFQNLIANAIKYRRTGEPVKVFADVSSEGGHWLYTVKDNGIGIPPEKRDTVFEAFRRLHRVDEVPGTGLGLFMCRRIVERHGGRIWVMDGPGPGTTFAFTLPKCDPHQAVGR